jgi:protease I
MKVLLRTNALRRRRIAADPSLQEEIRNAGAEWVDKPLVIDRDLVTCRGRDAISAFQKAFAQICLEHKAGTGASWHTD